ncbi:MAG: M48 family metallopeptidase [Armatimonadota bacterium]|nr:M48 family metallopeptidase [Armatimonadota bacterium]MDW8156960.1 M48 family metallopeptidase [Armatimonadota bacterium]
MERARWRQANHAVRVAAVAAALVLALPASAQVAIPEDQEMAVGRAVAARLMAQYGVVADPDWLAFLSALRDRLVPFSGRPQVPYRIAILDHREPNAVSTPGWVFVTTGLVQLNPDVDAWAFVVAHEVAHTARRHVAQHVARAQVGQIASILVAILTGSSAAGDLVQVLLRVSTLGFSRELEVEADREALRMLVEAGFDPRAAARTLQWFNQVTGRRQENTHWAGTHPGFADRVRAVERAYEEFPSRNLPLRVRHFRSAQPAGPLVLRPQRLSEHPQAWVLALAADNSSDRAVQVGVMEASLAGPDGELPVRFLRSTFPGEVGPRGRAEGLLVFERRTSAWPTALVLPVGTGPERVEARVDLSSGGPFAPPPQPAVLPRPPSLP